MTEFILEYTLLYENNEHDNYCSDSECTYNSEEINKQIIIPDMYVIYLRYYFVMLTTYLPIDIINAILSIRLEIMNHDFEKIKYKGKQIVIKFSDIDHNLYSKFFFTLYFIDNQLSPKHILGKKLRGCEYPSYYCGPGIYDGLGKHDHCITINTMCLRNNKV